MGNTNIFSNVSYKKRKVSTYSYYTTIVPPSNKFIIYHLLHYLFGLHGPSGVSRWTYHPLITQTFHYFHYQIKNVTLSKHSRLAVIPVRPKFSIMDAHLVHSVFKKQNERRDNWSSIVKHGDEYLIRLLRNGACWCILLSAIFLH